MKIKKIERMGYDRKNVVLSIRGVSSLGRASTIELSLQDPREFLGVVCTLISASTDIPVNRIRLSVRKLQETSRPDPYFITMEAGFEQIDIRLRLPGHFASEELAERRSADLQAALAALEAPDPSRTN